MAWDISLVMLLNDRLVNDPAGRLVARRAPYLCGGWCETRQVELASSVVLI